MRFVDAARVDAAMESNGFKTDLAIEGELQVRRGQLGRWKSHKSTPGGDAVEAICFRLGVSPAHLFGRSDAETADYLVRTGRRELGEEAGDVLGAMLKLDSAGRSKVVRAALQAALEGPAGGVRRDEPPAPIEPWQEPISESPGPAVASRPKRARAEKPKR